MRVIAFQLLWWIKAFCDCLPTIMADESILEDKRAGISDVAEEVEEKCLY